MKKIKEYCVLYAVYNDILTDKVNALIKDGWQPYRGVVVNSCVREDDVIYSLFFQAMVKYEE